MSDVTAVNPFAPRPTQAPERTDELGADTFLQLLVAQLKYQDPTSPSDGADFLAQTAQFTMVEKLTELAENAAASAVVNRNLGAASLVGRNISWLNPDGTTGTGVVESAHLGSDGPVLRVGGQDVPFDFVSQVTSATAARPAPAPSTTPEPSTQPTDPAATSGTTPVPTDAVTDDGSTAPTSSDDTTPATDGASLV